MAGPRPTWKGLLQISLVTIPIKVFPATDASESLSFNQLHSECRSRLTQKRWCPSCAREVPSAEIVKGFEFEPGKYVVLSDEDVDTVKPASTKTIELTAFAKASTLDPLYIDRSYYLGPDGERAGQPFAVIGQALIDLVGIGKLAIYGREYLVAVRAVPRRGTMSPLLLLHTLHHAAEIRSAEEVLEGADVARVPPEQVKLARSLIGAFAKPTLPLTAFTDAYRAGLQAVIDAKIAGNEILIPLAAPTAPVVNLKEALEQSLAAVRSGSKKPMAKAGLKRAR